MARFQKVTVPNDKDFSEWQYPQMEGYKIACCDCGLVHDMEFGIVQNKKDLGNGNFEADEIEDETFRVKFRAKRNNRSTGQLRRRNRIV